MGHINLLRRSFENLTEGVKEYSEYLDRSEVKKIHTSFIRFIELSIFSKNKNAIAKTIDWSIVLSIFNHEVERLIGKFAVPRGIEGADRLISNFRIELWQHLEKKIFSLIEYLINDIDNNQPKEDFNHSVGESANYLIPGFFTVFDIQFQLTSLNPNNDPKRILLDIEKTKKYKNHIDRLVGGHNIPDEIKAFNKIRQLYKEHIENENKTSYRELAFQIAEKDLGIDNEKDQKNFYNRFNRWHLKTK